MHGATPYVRTATAEDAPDLVALYRLAYRANAEIGYPSSVADCDRERAKRARRPRRLAAHASLRLADGKGATGGRRSRAPGANSASSIQMSAGAGGWQPRATCRTV